MTPAVAALERAVFQRLRPHLSKETRRQGRFNFADLRDYDGSAGKGGKGAFTAPHTDTRVGVDADGAWQDTDQARNGHAAALACLPLLPHRPPAAKRSSRRRWRTPTSSSSRSATRWSSG